MTETLSGPETPAPEQLDDVILLADSVFRSRRSGGMGAQYPLLFDAGRIEQLRIFRAGGRPVALAGMILNDCRLLGCDVRIACVGSVCTDPAYRGQGLAGRLMDDAAARAAAAGAAAMLISGGRTLYRRRGAFAEGRFHQYDIPTASLPQEAGLQIEQIQPAACAEAYQLCEAEPIRFRRTPDEYAVQIATAFTQDRPGATYTVRRSGAAAAVVSICRTGPPPDKDAADTILVAEVAGNRSAAVAALGKIAAEHRAGTVRIVSYVTDAAMAEACGRLGASPKVVSFGGSLKLLDARRLWSDFAPLLAGRIGAEPQRQITVRSEADDLKIHSVTFQAGSETATIDGAQAVLAALFGSPALAPLADLESPLAELLNRALPLPLPLYGMNYV